MIQFAVFPVFALPLAIGSGQTAISAEICGCEHKGICSIISALMMCVILVVASILLMKIPAAGVIMCLIYSVLSALSVGMSGVGSGPVC